MGGLASLEVSGSHQVLPRWNLGSPRIIELCLDVPGESGFRLAATVIGSKAAGGRSAVFLRGPFPRALSAGVRVAVLEGSLQCRREKRSMRGQVRSPRMGTWAAAVLLALAWPGSYPSQGGPPNLRPFQPPGWPDAIVVSNRQGDNAAGRVLRVLRPPLCGFRRHQRRRLPGGLALPDRPLRGRAADSRPSTCPRRSIPRPTGSARTTPSAAGAWGPTPCGSWPTRPARWPKATNPTTPTPGPSSSGAAAFR